MTYNVDLRKVDVQKYKTFLKNQYLIPSRQILHDNIDNNFKIFKNCGFKYLADLKQAISSNTKIDKLSNETKILPEYLNILRRELGAFDKKGIPFNEFPIIDKNIISKLDNKGIKNTKDFYEYYYKENNEKRVSDELSIPIELIKCLISLSGLVRINGIASLAAVTFYEAGYKTIKDITSSTKEKMLEKITEKNEEKKYYKAKLGLKDMQFVIDFANLIDNFDSKV
ncbi:MAG: DUF4332 domain-containing protein [Treponema sp.]|nr:DUF4332 domain-containing protein [Treponema sp.]